MPSIRSKVWKSERGTLVQHCSHPCHRNKWQSDNMSHGKGRKNCTPISGTFFFYVSSQLYMCDCVHNLGDPYYVKFTMIYAVYNVYIIINILCKTGLLLICWDFQISNHWMGLRRGFTNLNPKPIINIWLRTCICRCKWKLPFFFV